MTDLYDALLHAARMADRFEAEHGRPLTNADVLLAAALVEHGAADADQLPRIEAEPAAPPPRAAAGDVDESSTRTDSTTVELHDDDAPAGCDVPPCPTCGGAQWDNREKKLSGEYKANAPDTRCRNRDCDGCIWRLKVKHLTPAAAPVAPSPFDNDDDSDLPF